MISLLGEYECKVDAKGRLILPAGLKKQLGSVADESFVLNRDIFEECLVLYPKAEWQKVSKQVGSLNRFVKKNAMFIRRFNNGATPIDLDSSSRVLLPKHLLDYAGIEKEVIVSGIGERIEIWSKAKYGSMLDEDLDFASLSEEVMGGYSDNEPS